MFMNLIYIPAINIFFLYFLFFMVTGTDWKDFFFLQNLCLKSKHPFIGFVPGDDNTFHMVIWF